MVDEATATMSNKDLIARDGFGFDYCMVFPTEPNKLGEITPFASQVITDIKAAKLETKIYMSCQNDEILCEIRASIPRLQQFADFSNKKLRLDAAELKALAEAGDPEANIAPIKINDDPEISKRDPYSSIYGRYDRRASIQQIYAQDGEHGHPFTTGVRQDLIVDILKAPHHVGGGGLKVERMLTKGMILGFFPMHRPAVKADLSSRWLVWDQMPHAQPFWDIKEYFGCKVGLYFQFIGHYTWWLIPLSVIGVVTGLTVYATDTYEHPITLMFAAVVIIWATLMLEFWKRREARVALEWGMSDFESSELDRPEYVGELKMSAVTGRLTIYFPPKEARFRRTQAASAVCAFIMIVVSLIGAIYGLKWWMVYRTTGTWGRDYGNVIASVCNSVQIQILNFIYQKLVVKLTKYENHRTDTEYEDALVVKLFAFQFCNSYGSFAYLAFIGEPLVGVKCEAGCLKLVSQNLAIVFGVNLLVGNIMEVLMPFLKYKNKVKKELADAEKDPDAIITYAERQYVLERYDGIMGTLADYAELAIQFGYVTLFVVAFPLAPLLALLSNYVEIRSDAFKLLTQFQRPTPRGAQDIGKWQDIFSFLAQLCVVTNAGLVCFIYKDLIGSMKLSHQLWAFIFITYGTFLVIKVVKALVPDVPEDVELQLQRQDFLVSKVITKEEDDDDVQEMADRQLGKVHIALSPKHKEHAMGHD